MQWLKKLFGIKTQEEKFRLQLVEYENKAFEAQRKGDLEEAGKYKKAAEEIAEKLTNIDL